MELDTKSFLFMNQIFAIVTGIMANKVWTAKVMDINMIVSMALLVVGLGGVYVSYKGLNLLFSRNYKKIEK